MIGTSRHERFTKISQTYSNGIDFTPVSFSAAITAPSKSQHSNTNITYDFPVGTAKRVIRPQTFRKLGTTSQTFKYLPPDSLSAQIDSIPTELEQSATSTQTADVISNSLSNKHSSLNFSLEPRQLRTRTRILEDLLCVIRGGELERFELYGMFQMLCSSTVPFPPNTTVDCTLKMSGTRGSIKHVETNKKFFVPGHIPTQFSPGFENAYAVKVRVPLEKETLNGVVEAVPSAVLRYNIAPAFKAMVLKAAAFVSAFDQLPTKINQLFGSRSESSTPTFTNGIKILVRIAANPNFRTPLLDVTAMISLKKMLHVVLPPIEHKSDSQLDSTGGTIKDDSNKHPTEVSNIASTLSISAVPTFIIRDAHIGGRGLLHKVQGLINWQLEGSVAPGAAIELEAYLFISAAPSVPSANGTSPEDKGEALVDLTLSQLHMLERLCSTLPVVVKARYGTASVTKTRFEVTREEIGGRAVVGAAPGPEITGSVPSPVGVQEAYAARLEYRFLDPDT